MGENEHEIDSVESWKEFLKEPNQKKIPLSEYRGQIKTYVSSPKHWTKTGLETKQRDVSRLLETLKYDKLANDMFPDEIKIKSLQVFDYEQNKDYRICKVCEEKK